MATKKSKQKAKPAARAKGKIAAKPKRAAKTKPIAKTKRVATAKPKPVAKPKAVATPTPPMPVTVAVAMAPMPVVIAAAPPPAPKVGAKAKPAKTPSLVNQRRQLLKDKTLPELKAMLRTNEQITTGTKGKLVKRILDCVEHGNLPRCPTCGLGRLKFNKTSGYRCPGGYDDDEYMYCGFTATPEEITRPGWQFETPGGLV